MKKRFRAIKKIYIIAVLLTLITLSTIGISSASYLSQSCKRGVARNREEEAIRFTSNQLALVAKDAGETSYAKRIITYQEDEQESLSCEIDVKNYIPGSESLINEYTIMYTLKVEMKNGTKNKSYSLGSSLGEESKLTADDSGNCEFILENQKLQGRNKNKNSYTIGFYKADLNKLSITVTAIPENLVYTRNQFLAANIYPCTQSETKPFSCVGKFADQASGEEPNKFDAYNYEIVLANGRAQVTLTWDKKLYEIDPFFKTKLAEGDITESSEGKLVFIMDQTKGNDSYIIPFYKKNKTECNKLSWEDMSGKISISAEELAPQTVNN